MICYDKFTGEIYEYEFVEDYVRIWTKNIKLHEVLFYKDWKDKYITLSKL